MDLIQIGNDGQKIVDTNYWDLDNAKSGAFYLSWNAGAGRLLVPDLRLHEVVEMKTAIELLFEDDSDSPYSEHITIEQCDRSLPASDAGDDFVFLIYGRAGLLAEFTGKYRVVDSLPYLGAWGD